ncbi:MAG: SusD/RagB family nutrient-binding outer membrane lipoprotein [Chitinophagaceae bacterium]|nr:SusD/RagB family nutrient-binding outer membrane lipoprotein [Chitinophagaceae bacterium]MCW5928005.1 SusD/RagB family nutrient-binding outer membrane lipoprotein [Chitinophagaceae bacterium]
MKYINKILLAISTVVLLSACSKFEEINQNPYLVTEDQVQVEYFINGSIVGSQMDPHIAERIFVLYWKTAGQQQFGGGISTGTHNDGWSTDYYGGGYMGGWLNQINTGIQVAEAKIASGNIKEYTANLLQVARIWRVYLMSELADTFGPIPINAFQGENPEFADLKTVYYYLLDELKDASSKLNLDAPKPAARFDAAYGYDYGKWQRYANSLRLRLSMRLSEVDPAKAKSEFEAAATLPLITEAAHSFQIAERGGWDALTGVMTRTWNHFQLPATLNNLYVGLGGVKSEDQLDAEKHPFIKAANYAGLRLEDHFTTKTNDPHAGFWFDGLPYSIDPRAYLAYIIPGDINNAQFNRYGGDAAIITKRNLLGEANAVVKEVDAKFHWNGIINGDWGTKGSRNQLRSHIGSTPRHPEKFRNGTSSRAFFGNWETHFLLAEAAVRGWAVPVSGKQAYEAGIDASFAYYDAELGGSITSFAAAYKASQDYNYAGTSVSWDHTTEPPASVTKNFVNGYTNAAGTVSISYPVNNLYENGTIKNDRLTKIITQKFIAQNPWLPLETWNDHRRLGLPFYVNPAIENPLVNMPDLNNSNYMTSSIKFFPQRVKYPSNIQGSNQAGYDQAVQHLGGADVVLTPLWWAKH